MGFKQRMNRIDCIDKKINKKLKFFSEVLLLFFTKERNAQDTKRKV